LQAVGGLLGEDNFPTACWIELGGRPRTVIPDCQRVRPEVAGL